MENQNENSEENGLDLNGNCGGVEMPVNPPEGANPNGQWICRGGVPIWIEDIGE